MKICYLDGFIEPHLLVDAWRKQGLEITQDINDTVDIFFNASVPNYKKAKIVQEQFPDKPMINYVWDLYEWAWQGKRRNDYDWQDYGKMVAKSVEIWTPNKGTSLRVKEYLNRESTIIKSPITIYEQEGKDEGYVLDHMRDYPESNYGWPEKAGKELGIPVKQSMHKYSLDEYRRLVSNARFLVTPYKEASTGGLTLLEGLYNGVPSLVSNSPYCGAREYLGEFGTYFKHNDYEDFKKKFKKMYENPPIIDIVKAREYVNQNFTFDCVAKQMAERFRKIEITHCHK